MNSLIVSCAVFSVLQLLNLAGVADSWNTQNNIYPPKNSRLESRGYGGGDYENSADPYKNSADPYKKSADPYKKSADPYKTSKSLSRRSLSDNQNSETELGLNDLNLNSVNDQQMSIMSNVDGLSGGNGNTQIERLGGFGHKSGSEGISTNCRFMENGGRRPIRPSGPGGMREFNGGSESEGSGRSQNGRGRRGGPQSEEFGEFGGPGRFSGNGRMSGSSRMNGNGGMGGIGGFRESGGMNNIGSIGEQGGEFQFMEFNGPSDMI